MRAVDTIGYRQPVDKSSQSVSFRRYALLHGWARWLTRLPDIEDQKKKLIRLRGSNFGIAVNYDILALEYQRLDFLSHRALYAVGSFGLSGSSIWTEDGWVHTSKQEIDENNKERLKKYRDKSYRAKRLLQSIGLLHCKTCFDQGFVTNGDVSSNCPDCHIEGIVQVGDIHP